MVSLARQKHLSPALVAAARELLQTNLNSCNGQDVSQILFGLMLDKHSVPDAAETFRAIAPALAQHLRSDESFQVCLRDAAAFLIGRIALRPGSVPPFMLRGVWTPL